jgi:hypothetical protein
MVHELGSSTKRFGDPTTHTSTPKSVEEVVVKVMKTYKAFISDHGNYESKHGEFDSGGKHFEIHASYRGEGEGNVTRVIG